MKRRGFNDKIQSEQYLAAGLKVGTNFLGMFYNQRLQQPLSSYPTDMAYGQAKSKFKDKERQRPLLRNQGGVLGAYT